MATGIPSHSFGGIGSYLPTLSSFSEARVDPLAASLPSVLSYLPILQVAGVSLGLRNVLRVCQNIAWPTR